MRWGAATDTGRVRVENEDNYLAAERAFVVADGMGGHQAGEVAAALTVDLLRTRLSQPGAALDDVVAAVSDANRDIFQAAAANPEHQGMGTTVTGLVLLGDDEPDATPDHDGTVDDAGLPAPDREPVWALINVGDSRTYLFRHDRLRRITVDHSYVQELVATGHINDDEARTHPRRNIVTRALGVDPEVRVDAWTLPVVRGDRYLVCSDGLVDEVRDDDIAAVLATTEEPQATADALVALANANGGRDNVTVVVLDVLEGADPPEPSDELDLEPAWEDGNGDSTWAVDAPDGEATEFEDLASLVADAPAAAAATATWSCRPTRSR